MKGFFQSVRKRLDRLDAEKLREQYRLATDELSFFETVLKAMKEGAIVYDQTGAVVYRNAAAESLPEIDIPCGKASKHEISLTYPEERTYEVQTIPFDLGTLALVRDTTAERERTEAELRAGATKAVCDLAAGVAHEIGNPLNAISMNLQLLERDPTDRESLEICKTQVKRLDGIIREFLSALRVRKPVLASGSPATPLKNCLAALRQQLVDRAIHVTVNIPDALPAVALDRDQIEQVFFNLLKNALEAMSDGSAIDIEISADDSNVAIAFRDTGPGMDEDQLVHLFEPYHTSKKHGSGLGLMVSKRIIDDHGGSISVESEPGKGSVFTVKLPRIEKRVRALK